MNDVLKTNGSSRANPFTALLSHPFRPFFLLAGLYGALLAPVWLAVWFGALPLVQGINPLHWHAHEMLFGLVSAAIAGFMLTAMSNWTGTAPLRGWGLAGLVFLWLVGRLAMWQTEVFSPALAALADLSFLLVMSLYVAKVIVGSRNHRNLVMVALLALLLVANLLMHLDFSGLVPGLAPRGERLAINLILLLITVVAGRITPAFTTNWLKSQGSTGREVRSWPLLDRAALAAMALIIVVDLVAADSLTAAALALVAALLNGVRLAGWGVWHCRREPLLWILHLGYGWLVVALLLKGLSPFVADLPASLWLHAAGIGAMGVMILGVMTRVALGHTGRPLALPPGAVLIYGLITLAVLMRLLSALGWVAQRWPLIVSGAAFSTAFVVFMICYWRILVSARVDGKPG